MEQGHALLALIAIPLLTAAALVVVPSDRKDWGRILAVLSGAAMFVISVYVFADYKASGDEQFSFLLRYDWLENVGILGEDGITLHLGVDGIAATMVLLNGVVAFAGTLISWKIEDKNKDFFVLFFILSSELAVLPMYLLIAVWGASSRFPTFIRTKEYGAPKLMMMLVAASVP